jgi:hypothetical protein
MSRSRAADGGGAPRRSTRVRSRRSRRGGRRATRRRSAESQGPYRVRDRGAGCDLALWPAASRCRGERRRGRSAAPAQRGPASSPPPRCRASGIGGCRGRGSAGPRQRPALYACSEPGLSRWGRLVPPHAPAVSGPCGAASGAPRQALALRQSSASGAGPGRCRAARPSVLLDDYLNAARKASWARRRRPSSPLPSGTSAHWAALRSSQDPALCGGFCPCDLLEANQEVAARPALLESAASDVDLSASCQVAS